MVQLHYVDDDDDDDDGDDTVRMRNFEVDV